MHRPQRGPALPGACALALVFAAAAFAPARAQTPAPPPDTLLTPVSPAVGAAPHDSTAPAPAETPVPPPPAVAPAPADTSFDYPLLFAPRTRDEIQRDLDLQARVRAAAQRAMVDARALETRRRYEVDIKKSEIDAVKKRQDLAKKEKRDADAKSLDQDKKQLERQKDYLDDLRSCARADAEYQQATLDYASARDAASQAEVAVLGLGNFGDAGLRATSGARSAQSRWNDALKARAAAGGTLADREKTLCDRRKDAMEAWTKVSAPARI